MTFKQFSDLVANQFSSMQQGQPLFKSKVTGNQLWETYISSFKPKDNPVFRDPESSTHNCNLDKNFIRRYGNVVAIDSDYKIVTIWDIDLDSENPYYSSVKAMTELLKKSEIEDIFMETFYELNSLPYEKCKNNQNVFRLGFQETFKKYTEDEVKAFGVVNSHDVYTFNHFYGDLKRDYVDCYGNSIESIRSAFRDDKNVLKRGLTEISSDTLHLVKELIIQDSLLNGTSHISKIDAVLHKKIEFDTLGLKDKDNWTWLASYKFPHAKFRNELIGVLCTEISEGMDLEKACLNWNKRVDPANYMKAKAPISSTQIKQAQKFVEENGYEESFDRRFATIDDVSISEIIHAGSQKAEVKKASIFDGVKPRISTQHKQSEFDKVEEISIEKFMKDVLPNATSVEVMVENRMKGNFVTITTANNHDSKPIFKWNNNFSWTYNGNLSGKSMIQEAVKSAGGNIEGVMRFSIMWADGDGDNSDLDAHCIEPNRNEIYFSSKKSSRTGGNLDIDITQPNGKLAVENIVYPSLERLDTGEYLFFVRQFSSRGSKGFKAQLEVNGEIFDYSYDKPVQNDVKVASVTYKNGSFTIDNKLESSTSSQEVWGIHTQQFAKVNLVSLSPNHWGENNIGDKHYFFMLDGCKSDTPMRSFHNDNLISDLLPHRKVMDTLGYTLQLEADSNQLAGLGFNSTVRDELIVKVEGSFKRMLKIKF